MACPNWETAWLDDQCEQNPQSSPYCPTYQEPVIEEVYEPIVLEIIPEVEIPILPDYTIDLLIEIEMELELELESYEEEFTPEEIEVEMELEIEALSEPLEEVVPEEVEEEIEVTTEEEILVEEVPVVMVAAVEPEPEKTKEEIKNDKLNEIVAIKLSKISQQRALATTFEEQAALESYIIALLNFNAGYKNYNVLMPDGVGYESRDIYMDSFIPDNKRGLRNGLAQELLHKQMVDLQWQN